jgi:hypothetical protein
MTKGPSQFLSECSSSSEQNIFVCSRTPAQDPRLQLQPAVAAPVVALGYVVMAGGGEGVGAWCRVQGARAAQSRGHNGPLGSGGGARDIHIQRSRSVFSPPPKVYNFTNILLILFLSDQYLGYFKIHPD